MQLLQTHPNTSERPGYEARKMRRKVIEGSAGTIIKQTTVKNLPRTASVAGGGQRKKGAVIRQTTVKKTPANRHRGGGAETKKGELKENTGAKARETTVKTLPQATIVAGGGETKGENQHEVERRHNPQSREGGRCLAENAYKKRKQK